MPDIPDISSMSPDRWLSKMQTVREELLDEFERIFAVCEAPEEASEEFGELFTEYSVQAETGESRRLLEVGVEEEQLVFAHESEDATVEVVCADGDVWRDATEDGADRPDDVAGHHRELGIRILELIPWWAEGAFTRRTGSPRDFMD